MKKDNDDIVIEDDPDLVASTNIEKKLRERIKQAETKAKEYLNNWQRAQADFANIRRQDEKAKIEFLKFANLSLIEELIPVLDSFNIALSQGHKDFKPLYNQFMAALKASNLEELDPLGESFSPHEHEAIAMVETKKKNEDHKIIEVLQRGYKLNDRVIRPAKVRVGKFISNK